MSCELVDLDTADMVAEEADAMVAEEEVAGVRDLDLATFVRSIKVTAMETDSLLAMVLPGRSLPASSLEALETVAADLMAHLAPKVVLAAQVGIKPMR